MVRLQAEGMGEKLGISVFDDRGATREARGARSPVAGNVDDLVGFARLHELDTIILTLPVSARERLRTISRQLRSLPTDVAILDDASAAERSVDDHLVIAGERLRVLSKRPISGVGATVKQTMDFALSFAAIVVFAIPMLLISILIALDSPGGVLFRQTRIGFNNKPFTMLKFRSMRNDARDQEGRHGTTFGDPRVTRMGRVLRRFSIDELPQLFNVLAGSMSLVGPRAQSIHMLVCNQPYIDAVDPYIERHRVKPGLTGWAQVNGARGGIHTLEKAAWAVSMDLEYIRNWSPALDIKIIWKTIWMVLGGRGTV